MQYIHARCTGIVGSSGEYYVPYYCGQFWVYNAMPIYTIVD